MSNHGLKESCELSACQPYDSLVLTEKGPMPIGSIVENDMIGLQVYDGNGLTRVESVKYNGRKPVYRIELIDGHYVDASEDHVVCAHHVRRSVNPERRRVDELNPGMFMRVYTRSAVTDISSDNDTEVAECALAGWLQTDGFVGKYDHGTNRSPTLEYMTRSCDEHNWVMRHLNTLFPDDHYNIRDVHTLDSRLSLKRIRFYGAKFQSFVDRYELMRRDPDIRISSAVFQASDAAVVAYLRSVYQADGYVSVRSSSAVIGCSTSSFKFMHDLQVLMTRVGVYSRLQLKEDKREDRRNQFCLCIQTLSERRRFEQEIGFIEDIKEAKLEDANRLNGKECPEVRHVPIQSITLKETTGVYGIQTASGQYLSEGILVHSCLRMNRFSTTINRSDGVSYRWSQIRLPCPVVCRSVRTRYRSSSD